MSFPLSRTMICPDLDCSTVYDAAAARVCPRCQSTQTYPIEQFFRSRDGRTHTRATLAELVRLRALKTA